MSIVRALAALAKRLGMKGEAELGPALERAMAKGAVRLDPETGARNYDVVPDDMGLSAYLNERGDVAGPMIAAQRDRASHNRHGLGMGPEPTMDEIIAQTDVGGLDDLLRERLGAYGVGQRMEDFPLLSAPVALPLGALGALERSRSRRKA